MGQLFDQIKQAVAKESYIIGRHANERLRQRRIAGWQIVTGLEHGILIVERPDAAPNPCIEVEQLLADGTTVKTVWSWLGTERSAKLVTVHFFGT